MTTTPSPSKSISEESEAPLLPRIAAGESAAVELCLRRYGSLVWTVARRFLNQAADVEDAVQDIFADLWARADRFDPSLATEKTWVLMIARRRLIDRKRREARRPRLGPLDFELSSQTAGEEGAADREDLVRARSAMADLRPEQRQVLDLALVQGLSHGAIAAQLALPLGTVKTHARRGLAALRSSLGLLSKASDGGLES